MPLQLFGAHLRAPALAIVLAAICLTLGSVDAFAAKGGNGSGGSGSSGGGLSLMREYVSNSPNQWAPTWCLNEDDWHKRSWSGSLRGSFTATEQICDSSVDYSGGIWWNGGGTGLHADVYAGGTLTDLAITSPNGDTQHGVLVSSTTSKGATTNHYAVCYVPPYSRSSNTAGGFLPGSTWQLSVAGDITNVNYSVEARMTDATFQQQSCPAAQQNLTP
jgi:hypothetical protein